ncbi:MAG: hypothetical protein KJ630_23515 [Proteobacteria bacterium]|nr:hypothetical protein [Pseudomonadota bacterium]
MSIITIELLNKIKEHYTLDWLNGTHNFKHWARVFANGQQLSEQQGVNSKVVQLFSVFHDSQRRNEHLDPGHGPRGARLALHLREYLPLTDDEFELLTIACSEHTKSRTHDVISVQACFDSDRLDLWRIGVKPDPEFLCTPMGKLPATIEAAYERSINKISENPFGIVGSQFETVVV